jgi:hypothetical protein
MRQGFSLLELILSLLLFQIGVLATVGMVLLSQRNLRRAELTLRGVLEAVWVADSLSAVGNEGPGRLELPWGDLSWTIMDQPVPGLTVAAWSSLEQDTLAWAHVLPPARVVVPNWPDSVPDQQRW